MRDNTCTAIVLHPTANAEDDYADSSQVPGNAAAWKGKVTSSYSRSASEFRGLSNQGATCYLNSLLQSLFMTPEFRSALFKWRYDQEKDGPKEECIPYQLQSLFGQMQLCTSGSLTTQALTRSFGWGNAEAFQQQDVQELCRVLFDRLEETFKGTEHATMVNDLYQGSMVDYLKMIGYSYESLKHETFLDMSLQVKAFGSDVAMNSVSESLESFLRPEKLEGDNQVFCEEADQKFDAIKGFRLEKLPYVFTFQLKRFDLDYNTFQRIKLNDQVRFPLILNMNPYVASSSGDDDNENVIRTKFERSMSEERQRLMKTDTESQDDEVKEAAPEAIPLPDLVDADGNKHPEQLKEEEVRYPEDETIDPATIIANEGPWVYELYSVLIHSGSALGGHYYAYIKNLETGKWYNFNDSSVTEIPAAQVRNAWGGSGNNGSSVYGANAYMLMYRQIDPQRNEPLPLADHVPAYITEAVREREEKVRKQAAEQERLNNQLQLRIIRGGAGGRAGVEEGDKPEEATVYISKHATLNDLKREAAKKLGMRVCVDNTTADDDNDDVDKPDSAAGKEEQTTEKDVPVPSLEDPDLDGMPGLEGNDMPILEDPDLDGMPGLEDNDMPILEDPDLDGMPGLEGNDMPMPIWKGGETASSVAIPSEAEAKNLPLVQLSDLRLREYSIQYSIMQKPYPEESNETSLLQLRFYDYKTTALEVREPGVPWEDFDERSMILKLAVLNEAKGVLEAPIAISVARDATVKDLRRAVASNTKARNALGLIDEEESGGGGGGGLRTEALSLFKIIQSTSAPKADVFEDDTKRLSCDLYLYEGQTVYAERVIPEQESRALQIYMLAMNQITVNLSGLDEDTCSYTILADRRWTIKRFREAVVEALGFAPDKQFRLRKQIVQGIEVKISETRLVREEAFFNDCKIFVSSGRAPLYGEFYWKFSIFNPKDSISGLYDNDALVEGLSQSALEGPAPVPVAEGKQEDSTIGDCAIVDTEDEVKGNSDEGVESADCFLEIDEDDDDSDGMPELISVDEWGDGGGGGVHIKSIHDKERGGGGGGTVDQTLESEEPVPKTERASTEPKEVEGIAGQVVASSPSALNFTDVNFQLIVSEGLMLEDLRASIHTELVKLEVIGKDLPVNCVRMREKMSNRCTKILRDGECLRDAVHSIYDNRDLAVEILKDPEDLNVTNPGRGYVVALRRWHRTSWNLSKNFDFFLGEHEKNVDVCRRLAKMTGIAEEKLRVLKVVAYSNITVHELSEERVNHQSWVDLLAEPESLTTNKYHFMDGDLVVVQDSSEPLRNLSEEEKRSIKKASNRQTNNYYSHTYYNNSASSMSHTSTSRSASGCSTKPKEAGIKIKTKQDREDEHRRRDEKEGGTTEASPIIVESSLPTVANNKNVSSDIEYNDFDPVSVATAEMLVDSENQARTMFGNDVDMLD